MKELYDAPVPLFSGTNAARPTAGQAGRLYRTTDSPFGLFQDDGSAWIPVGPLLARIDADLAAITSTTYVDQTGLSFTLDANGIYICHAILYYVSSATTEGSMFSLNGPTSPIYVQGKTLLYAGGGSILGNTQGNAYDWGTATATGTGATVGHTELYAYISNGANAGTLIVRGLTETGGANTTTIKRGSHALLYRVG